MAPLPNDVLALMKRTMELVDLLYWMPAPSKLTERVVAASFANRRQNPIRTVRPNPMTNTMERIASDETEEMQDVGQLSLSRYKRMRWFRDADFNTRMAYGRAVMSGHDRDYDPALFEDAYPVNYEHSEKDVGAWAQDVDKNFSDDF